MFKHSFICDYSGNSERTFNHCKTKKPQRTEICSFDVTKLHDAILGKCCWNNCVIVQKLYRNDQKLSNEETEERTQKWENMACLTTILRVIAFN